jgi:hypothetical protein
MADPDPRSLDLAHHAGGAGTLTRDLVAPSS